MKKNFRLLLITSLAVLCWHPVASPTVASVVHGIKAWDKTAFDATNGKLFVAASTAAVGGGPNNAAGLGDRVSFYNLPRANGVSVPTLVPLTTNVATSVNGANVAASPLNDKPIAILTVTPSGKPVVVQDNGAGAGAAVMDQYLFQDPATGTKMLKSNLGYEDAAHLAVITTKVPVAIAASDDHILVASPGKAAVFGVGVTSGFALTRIDPNGLTIVKADDGVAGAAGANNAYALNPDTKGDAVGSVSVVRDGAVGAIALDVTVDPAADMYYDQKLDRFFVGLDKVARSAANANNADGLTSLLVGRLVPNADGTKKLVMRAAVNAMGYLAPGNALADDFEWKDVFTTVVRDQIIGVGEPAAGGAHIAANAGAVAHKVRTMHTSTGKDYVVINGGSDADVTNAGVLAKLAASVYALPVLPKTLDATGKDDGKAGIIAKVNGAGAYTPVGVGEVPVKGPSTFVGVDYGYLGHKAANLPAIQDMNIVGDTVYVSLAGDRAGVLGAAAEAGVFASTAIFDENGNVRAWTPWDRAATSIDNTYGFGVEQDTGNIWYLTSDTGIQGAGNDKKVVKVTQWNKGDKTATAHNNVPLATTAEAKFPATGILNIVNFDDETIGFRKPYTAAADNLVPATAYPPFSMMVATGNGQVALVETGKYSTAVTAGKRLTLTYWPTKEFASSSPRALGDAAFVYEDAALKALGPITTAEVARVGLAGGPATNGYLFVGGIGGVGVLSGAAGIGWDTSNVPAQNLAGFVHNAFPGDAAWTFKQLTNVTNAPDGITDVRKLVSDGFYLYILTKNKLYRIDIAAADYAAGAVNDLRFAVLADLAPIAGATTANGLPTALGAAVDTPIFDATVDEFYDMVLVDGTTAALGVGGKLLLATSKGLYVSVDLDAAAHTGSINEAKATFNPANLRWKKPVDKAGADNTFACGPAFKLNFVNENRGGKLGDAVGGIGMLKPASGNLYVTAVDKDYNNMCVYRFNVSGGAVKAFKEPYTEKAANVVIDPLFPENSNNTDYFYKIGSVADIVTDVNLDDSFDMQPQAKEFGNHGVAGDFVGGVAMTPDPSFFLNAGLKRSAIDLGADLSNGIQLANVVKDTASGALYVPGEFGVRVNE